MSKTFLGLCILVLVGVAAWYFWPAQMSTLSIRITAPVSDDAWQSGEERQIRWQSSGVPEGHKIAISIRRIPPPPLQEEGQEFDPIVFTNLPNTGSVAWTISPMYPDGTYALSINAYESLPMTNPVSTESEPFAIAHPKLADALYPLYDGVNWQGSRVESMVAGTTTYAGASITSYPTIDTMDPASIFMPFEQYYKEKLRALGWKEDLNLAAGGHTGGQTGYRNGDATILTRFHIEYKNVPGNAPSECPCDVTLSIFSSGE